MIYIVISRATTKALTEVGKAKNPIARVRYASCKYSNNPNKVRKGRTDEWQQQNNNRGDEKNNRIETYIQLYQQFY